MVDYNFAAGQDWCRLNVTAEDGKKYDVAILGGYFVISEHDKPMDFVPIVDAFSKYTMFEKLCGIVSHFPPKFVCDRCINGALDFALENLERDGLNE